jgi:hypothetical protein
MGPKSDVVTLDIKEYDKGDKPFPVDDHFFLEVFEVGEESFAFYSS